MSKLQKKNLKEKNKYIFPGNPIAGKAVKKMKLTSYYTQKMNASDANKMIRELYLCSRS